MEEQNINHEKWMREAIYVSINAIQNGNHPFGAIFVDPKQQKVIASAENTVATEKDCTGHAETNLVRILSKNLTFKQISEGILYTSTEPCAMCSGAIFWCGVKKVVFGLRATEMYKLVGEEIGEENAQLLKISCNEVLLKGNHATEIIGPILEEEAKIPHLGFWKEFLEENQKEEMELTSSLASIVLSPKKKIRKGFVMQLFSGQEAEYERRHNPIWEDLEESIKAHGGSNYSIFLNQETNQLFGYLEIEDEERWNKLAKTEICQKWWKYMAPLMETNADFSPIAISLKHIFFLE